MGNSSVDEAEEDYSPEDSRSEGELDSQFYTMIADAGEVDSEQPSLAQFNEKHLENLFDRYQLISKFNEGTQGILTTALDKSLRRYVAIKSLKPNYVEKQEVISRFITEAMITAQLDHPSIVPLYGISKDNDGGCHIAMKLIHGNTLKDHIKAQRNALQKQPKDAAAMENRALPERLEHFIKVCDAISYAHNKKVIHHDLKPQNIMIGSYHQVFVMDWGIAQVQDHELTTGEVLSGTPGYLAPERLNGQPATPVVDQYALGAILFELVTLKNSIAGSKGKERLENTKAGNLAPITHQLRQCTISPDIKAVISRATQFNPEDRYASVEAMATDIRRFLKGEELAARPDNLVRRSLRLFTKYRAATAVSFIVVLLFAASVTIFSLIAQKQSVELSKQRELKTVGYHNAIERRAHDIDSHFKSLANILERYGDRVEFLLQRPSYSSSQRVYPYHLFQDLASAPEQTLFSPLYQQNVNLLYGSYALAPGLSPEEVEPTLDSVNTLFDGIFSYLAASDPNTHSRPDSLQDIAVTTGFPIRWIYFATSNGLIVYYPGSGVLPDDYDPRQRPWYLAAKDFRGVKWSAPYVDAFGQGVIISASKSLWSLDRRFLGVASIDITFDYTRSRMILSDQDDSSVLTRYLINEKGEIVISWELNEEAVKEAQKDFSTVEFEPYPHAELVNEIRQNNSGQMELLENGKTLLIIYAPIRTLGWYMVEEIERSY